MMNIRELNKIIELNIYSMSLQIDITTFVIDCFYVSIFDAINFFYQWLMRITNRYKFIVISHRDQKQFNVIVMSFKNSSFYVQRKIDNLLRVVRRFAKVYVDDIIIFNKILKKHLTHLREIFNILNSYEVRLSFKKFFFDYSIVVLLKQKIDVFEFIIVVDKLIVIIKLRFFYIFKNLEKYLELIEWLRNYIAWYVQIFDSLLKRKTFLLRSFSSNKNRQRKIYFVKTILQKFFVVELKFYWQFQKNFDKTNLLIHYDFIRIIYINVDVSKQRDFEVIIYHLKFTANFNNFKRNEIELIMFFNRMFTSTKKRYWSTKLKMIDLMWIIRRVKHIIEIFKHVTMIFIDHVVNFSIARQITLIFNNIDKLNLWFVRIFIYFFQFRIDVRYRFDKRHVIFDVLFKLSIEIFFLNDDENLKLKNYHNNLTNSFDHFYVYNDAFINMSTNFRQQLIDDYVKKNLNRIHCHAHRFDETNKIENFFLIKAIDCENHSQSTTKNNFSSTIKNDFQFENNSSFF